MCTECLFCQISAGAIPGDIVYANEHVIAFRDIQPQAPVHILIIPRRHIAALTDVTDEDIPLLGKIQRAAALVAQQEGIAEAGYRTVYNCGSDGQQTVPHLHLHLLGGRNMTWPPG